VHTTRHATAAALVLVGALALAGCSGSKGPSSEKLGPITQRLEDIYGSFDNGVMNAQQAQIEEITAACMKEQGFDYTPVDYSSAFEAASDDDQPEWGTLEFAKQYGYGISTYEELSGAWAVGDGVSDPNTDYVNAMSPEEQTAYYEALYGSMSMVDDGAATDGEVSADTYDWSTAGCAGKAQHDVYGDAVEESTITTDLDAMSSQAAKDEKVVQATDAWVSCMSDAGYDYSDPEAPYTDLSDAMNALYDESGSLDESGLESLKKKEIATAVDDFTCQDSSGLTDAKAAAQRDLEEAYYADHKAEVDAWLASLEKAVNGEG
jgi:hypothetical protein